MSSGMLCLPSASPHWRNECCTFLDPAVYPGVRMRCNHTRCIVRTDDDLALDMSSDEEPVCKRLRNTPPAASFVEHEADDGTMDQDTLDRCPL